jgi:hypothetical protein
MNWKRVIVILIVVGVVSAVALVFLRPAVAPD